MTLFLRTNRSNYKAHKKQGFVEHQAPVACLTSCFPRVFLSSLYFGYISKCIYQIKYKFRQLKKGNARYKIYISKRELVLLLKEIFFICGTLVATGEEKYIFPHRHVDFTRELTKRQ